jgi:hypothetical protein
MIQDTASKFFRPLLTEGDVQQSLAVSPYFLAYLQAKIEAYATALLETTLPYDPDPTKQVAAIVAFERARTFVQAYEELLAELMDARQQDIDSPTSR